MDGLKKEPLGKFEILVSADHTFGTDDSLANLEEDSS